MRKVREVFTGGNNKRHNNMHSGSGGEDLSFRYCLRSL